MVEKTEINRKKVVESAILSFYTANGARELPKDDFLDAALKTAMEDWAKIPDHQLEPSILLARQTPREGPLRNGHVLVAWGSVMASEARKRRDEEVATLRNRNRSKFSEESDEMEPGEFGKMWRETLRVFN